MAENFSFLETIETYDRERATAQAIYAGEGRTVRGAREMREARQRDFKSKLAFFGETVDKMLRGDRFALFTFQEAMTSSDFPLLFGDVIDRAVWANYIATNNTWRNYVHYSTVADFRQVHRFAINGSQGLLAIVAQGDEYPESSVSEVMYNYQVAKYGRLVPFAWETMVNDDLNALKDIPAFLGRAAARTEEWFATQLFASSTGPNSTFFANGNNNLINSTVNPSISVADPALSISALQDAMTILGSQKDPDGQPIFVDAVELVVPPSLEVVANNILNATEIWLGGDGQVGGGGVAGQQVHTVNWMRNRTHLNVNYQLPLIDTTHGNTSWYLFASPDVTRPALEVGHLRGHETPELFVKAPTSMRIGGGAADPMDGDFQTDSIVYKLRHVMGGTLGDPRMAVASNGTNS